MKIKSNLEFNTSILARHMKLDKDATSVVIGGSASEYLLIPAGATIELADSAWKKFEGKTSEGLLKAGHLTMVVAPKLTKKEEAEAEAKAVADAEALLAKLKPKKSHKSKAEAKVETKEA
jgi:hypothetical protein